MTNTIVSKEKERLYYLDWLRVLAFWLLILFHSWQPFNHFHWLIKSTEQTIFADILTVFTHGWRLHLIFLVSGVGTWFAIKSHKSAFFLDRLKRLIVPFIFSIIVLCPPQRFFQKLQTEGSNESLIQFLSHYPHTVFSNEFGLSFLLWFKELGIHVWYLPYLLVMTLMTFPIMSLLTKHKIRVRNFIDNELKNPITLFLFALPIFFFRLSLKPLFPAYTDWADFFTYIWPFLYGYIIVSNHNSILPILNKNQSAFLIVGTLSSLTLILGSLNEELVKTYLAPEFNEFHIVISLLSAMIAFCWPLFFVSLFSRKFNFQNRLLPTANESILPIYIVHQMFIVWIGYYIISLGIGPFFQFILICISTILLSLTTYLLIKRNNWSRLIFGLKLKHRNLKTMPNIL